MTINQILAKEFQFIHNWTTGLISSLDEEQWKVTPSVVNTNIHWLSGHILHDNYWHAIGCITQPSYEFQSALEIDRFKKYFQKDSDSSAYIEERPGREEILDGLSLCNMEVLKVVKDMTESELEQQTLVPNPVAKTKYESLIFAVKHQMWHNGQIAMLRRIIEKA
ncbi:DinB family protein [Croceitalea rosinachiae]|uniref:DinB family protein n=1 Tax=Croceitalea rosinachiae TaxID=3075596 RepID=A0ABU3AD82_9FLAO|nr:DinB family protein [Croceitalea sp. F388]MDT0608140.1 DinB family protein [Croceitalea sp. F388]